MAGGKKPPLSGDTLLHRLPFGVVKNLSLRLDIDRQWEKLVMKIPRNLKDVGSSDPNCEMRYSQLQIRLFDDKSKRPDGSPTNAIINDWATQNTQVKHLLTILQLSALYEVADYISENVLGQGKVPRLNAQTNEEPSLDVPAWPNTKGNQNEKKEGISTSNFNASQEKGMYKQEKGLSFGDGFYHGLNQSRNENDYRMISTDGQGAIYNRVPSYTSGDSSVLLRDEPGSSPSQQPMASEHDDSIYSKAKPIPDDDPYYSYAVQPNGRALACQANIDEPKDHNASKTDIYKLIGPQKMLKYELLKRVTNDFDCKLLKDGGRIIGAGGFGDVYLGIFDNGFKVAVKKLKNNDEVDKQFKTEHESLMKYRHRNIVCLYAFSTDGPSKCLIYEYLPNGSLEDRLLKKDQTPALSVELRVSILRGTAEGIAYLNSEGIVHRDIKSANVLLDETFLPKVGDFATARSGPRGNATMPMSTSVVIGTSAYLAPEAMNFDISTKLDAYSFGVIVLEALTALPALDQEREERDLRSHVEECEIFDILDNSGGKWATEIVDKLMEISEKCAKKKKFRCNVADILPDLTALSNL